jgi:LacI family transcriptional regulator
MQITLKDIARMADVAESTVSRALNDKPGVGRETKLKILKIAKENNYRPNQLARGLAAKKTNMIAVILAEMDSPGNIEIVKSIHYKEYWKNFV